MKKKEEQFDNVGIYDNPDLSEEAKIAHLQQECKEKGVEFDINDGVEELKELLETSKPNIVISLILLGLGCYLIYYAAKLLTM